MHAMDGNAFFANKRKRIGFESGLGRKLQQSVEASGCALQHCLHRSLLYSSELCRLTR
jgi:hypothetical protein